MSTTPSASPSRCSLAALERGDVPVGTAVPARYWMLVGHPGPWPAKPIAAPGIVEVRDDLEAALGRFGARLQLIRRHGRLDGDQIEAEGLRQVFLVDVHRGLVGRAHWERPEDLVELAGRFDDLPDPTSEPLFLVCTHGRKDVCCAVEGRVVAAVLDDALPGAVWETTHLGGDRFAGNVVILPEGSMYGRLTGDTAPRVVLDHLDGRVDLDRWRGRCSWHPAAQAAAHDLMRADPTVLLRDLARPRLEERGDEAWLVHLDHGGGTSLRHVVRTMSAPHQLTCGGAAKVQALFDVTTPG
ncbi:sucrase ferredoxin [Janibacter indicus]|uniref:Sucrase ferredoxin n=1 Tax=Janibacter indicus TaxID=857417 RepID=A0A7L9J0I1_9MICO|nr:sucrase ferredoxin [Janibacter indicus]QOK22627.1 sucrase ferredoxin [Janibacter indicus]